MWVQTIDPFCIAAAAAQDACSALALLQAGAAVVHAIYKPNTALPLSKEAPDSRQPSS